MISNFELQNFVYNIFKLQLKCEIFLVTIIPENRSTPRNKIVTKTKYIQVAHFVGILNLILVCTQGRAQEKNSEGFGEN